MKWIKSYPAMKQLKNKLLTTTVGLAIFTCTPVFAAKIPEPISINLMKLATAKSVTFYVNPDNKKFSDENSFKESSCHFTVENSQDITTLTLILGHGDLEKGSSTDATFIPSEGRSVMPNLASAIDFTFADGTQAQFMVSSDPGRLGKVGILFTHPPKFTEARVYGYHALPWHLLYWANNSGVLEAKDRKTFQACERYINSKLHPNNIYLGP